MRADLKNAFNCVERGPMLAEVKEHDGLAPSPDADAELEGGEVPGHLLGHGGHSHLGHEPPQQVPDGDWPDPTIFLAA